MFDNDEAAGPAERAEAQQRLNERPEYHEDMAKIERCSLCGRWKIFEHLGVKWSECGKCGTTKWMRGRGSVLLDRIKELEEHSSTFVINGDRITVTDLNGIRKTYTIVGLPDAH